MPHSLDGDYTHEDLKIAALSCAAEVFASLAEDPTLTPDDVLDFAKVILEWIRVDETYSAEIRHLSAQ